MTLSNYSFLPWLRQGIANYIQSGDNDPNVKLRAEVQVDLQLNAEKLDGGTQTETITRKVQLFGPGDIVGIESRAIIRTDPRNWITNYEPNYLPCIEFYDEDFPWRYTPAKPDGTKHRLRPWIILIVLKEGEFEDGTNIKDRPLAYIKVDDLTLFPPADLLWAWAHVHVNRSLTANDQEITSGDMNAVLPRLQNALKENPDLAYSRLISPRHLEPNAPYHAFVIPTFESGRLAGLGLDPGTAPNATQSAWVAYQSRAEPQFYPIYYRWYFRTGEIGDFEYLVRLLEAKPVNPKVGKRDMDVLFPGANLPPIDDPELGGVLQLGGALRAPDSPNFDDWDDPTPHPFEVELAKLVNLADEYAEKTVPEAHADAGIEPPEDPDDTDDPLITPPIYGHWHALSNRLLSDKDGTPLPNPDNWLHELNLDPRYRVPAGFGTHVVQANQEEYMDGAWGQIGDVLEANRRIREAQLAKSVAWIWHERHLKPMAAVQPDKAFMFTAPLARRVIVQGSTVQHHLTGSVLPPVLASTTMRRTLRPGGRLMTRASFEGQANRANLLTRISAGQVVAVPPKPTPEGLPSPDAIGEELAKTELADRPSWLLDLLRRYPWLVKATLLLIPLVALVILLLFFTIIIIPIGLAIIVGLVYLYRYLSRVAGELERAESLLPTHQTPGAVDKLPKSPDFVLSDPEHPVTPTQGRRDSAEAKRFKESLRDANAVMDVSRKSGEVPPLKGVNLGVLTNASIAAIDPQITVPKRTWGSLFIPDRIWDSLVLPAPEEFVEAMAYPEFDIPMYCPLVTLSSDLFLPNIQLIDQNSITLLKTNQKFIESYMVGLNHEFARELLWREYPTDQRGSYFRQFWDVTGYMDTENLSAEALREKLRDIPPLHRWGKRSKLGEHDNRDEGGPAEDEVVLVIRGELLKKYPTAVIYAHQAEWRRNLDGTIDNTKERRLREPEDLPQPRPADPLKVLIKTPLYDARIDPDIYFFGFDLTVEEVQGGTGENPNDPAGWFFVIKERPGEPRFGLDIDKQPQLNVWNDLAWGDVLPGNGGGFVPLNQTFTLVNPSGDASLAEKVEQYKDDKNILWNPNTNAAELAYILYQSPVLVAVHASEMLRRK